MNKFNSAEEIPPDLIEKQICIPIKNSNKVPMTPEDAETFVMISMIPETRIFTKEMLESPEMRLFNLIKKRLEIFDFKFANDKAAFMFMFFCSGTPGNAVMLLWYLQHWTKINNKKEVTSLDLGMKIFPNGQPSEKDLSKIWYDSKIEIDGRDYNAVDVGNAGISLKHE